MNSTAMQALMDHIQNSTMRDVLAMTASDEDIQSLRSSVPLTCVLIEKLQGGSRRVRSGVLPDNWRQIARYMHADRMLAARAGESWGPT